METRTRGDANELIRYGRLHSTTRKPTKNEKTKLTTLVAQRDAAHTELNTYYDEDGEEDEARHDRLSTVVDVATYAATNTPNASKCSHRRTCNAPGRSSISMTMDS